MESIAIPIYDGRVSNRLDCSQHFLLVCVENKVITGREEVLFAELSLSAKTNALKKLGVDVLICNGIPERYAHRLQDSNIRVFAWICGSVDEVLSRYLTGELKSGIYGACDKSSGDSG